MYFLAAFLSLAPVSAYAYIDPGTGSVILQALVAGVLGSMFVIKTYWAKITSFFRKKGDDQ
jgi:hypothetical protein